MPANLKTLLTLAVLSLTSCTTIKNAGQYLVHGCLKPEITGYQTVGCLVNDAAIVSKNSKYGVINKQGMLLVPLEYDFIDKFENNIARVKKHNKYGFVNTSGYVIASPKYDSASQFNSSLAKVSMASKYGFINSKGNIITPIKYDDVEQFFGSVKVKQHGKFGLLTTTGKILVPIKYHEIGLFSENLAKVRLNNKYGFINTAGKLTIPIQYDWVGDFQNGNAKVKNTVLFGAINTSGETVLPIKFDNIITLNNGYFKVEKSGSHGIYNKLGETVIDLKKYKAIKSFTGNVAKVQSWSSNYGMIDHFGREVIKPLYDEIYPLADDIFAVTSMFKYKIIDSKGFSLTTSNFEKITVLEKGLYKTKDVFGKYGLFDIRKGEILRPTYAMIGKFTNGLAPIQLSRYGKYGLINNKGEPILKCEYDEIQDHTENLKTHSHFDYDNISLDISNNTGNKIRKSDIFDDNKNIYLKVKKNGKYGLINYQGKLAIPAVYDEIDNYSGSKLSQHITFGFSDFGKVKVKKDGKTFYVDRYGKNVQ